MADGAERQLVVFDLANEVYGINIGTVREIIRMQTVTFVPDAPEFVKGVINLRGRVIPVVDLRKRFGLPVTEPTPESRVLVVDIAGNDIGVIVDAVTEVQRIAEIFTRAAAVPVAPVAPVAELAPLAPVEAGVPAAVVAAGVVVLGAAVVGNVAAGTVAVGVAVVPVHAAAARAAAAMPVRRNAGR